LCFKTIDQFKYYSQAGAKSEEAAMFAITNGMDNLEEKKWPDLDKIVDTEAAKTTEVMYYAINKSKNKQGLTAEEVSKPNVHSLNPTVYVRSH